mmetsp:Transcript_33676/g.52017  ORF Transcript_33676/g.52017 Transcript_33676/m.52017 type:complete len:86 (+) Transcript_33676:2-259(+)
MDPTPTPTHTKKKGKAPQPTMEGPQLAKQLFLIRHGERADKLPQLKIKYKPDYDPPLTPTGQRQAFNSGRYIKYYLENEALLSDG